MVGPDSANEKTNLFDGENNLKVISKPPHQPPNNASSTSSSHQPDNIANGDNNSGTWIQILRVRYRITKYCLRLIAKINTLKWYFSR